MNIKTSDALLACSLSVCASGLICGAALISESISGELQDKPARATQLFFSALGLTHIAVLPLELARITAEQEQA
jgi:peptidase E